MSQLCRFKLNNKYTKARIYEQSSRKMPCMCCGKTMFGVLIRHYEPDKQPDTLICNECIITMALGLPIELENGYVFGRYSVKHIINSTRIRKPLKRGPKVAKVRPKTEKCPYCGDMFTVQGLPSHVMNRHPNEKQLEIIDEIEEDEDILIEDELDTDMEQQVAEEV